MRHYALFPSLHNCLIFMCKFAKRIHLRPWRIFLLFVASPCSEIQWIRRRLERTSIVKTRDHSNYWVQQRVSILTRVNIERCIRRKFAFSGGVLFWLASRTLCRFSKVVVNKKEFGKDSQGGEVGNGSSARFSSKKRCIYSEMNGSCLWLHYHSTRSVRILFSALLSLYHIASLKHRGLHFCTPSSFGSNISCISTYCLPYCLLP